jgi:hypothetical protein
MHQGIGPAYISDPEFPAVNSGKIERQTIVTKVQFENATLGFLIKYLRFNQ